MGVHALAPLVRPPSLYSLVFHILFQLIITYVGTPVQGVEEAEALLKFKSSLTHNEAISSWNSSSAPCPDGSTSKWSGVICSYGKVWGLQLENMGLAGPINMDALSQLPELRTLSFKNNKFEGPIPDFRRIPKLRALFLSHNKFAGEIPQDAFAGMDALRRVVLSNNAFTGNIPSSLTTIPLLVELKLDGNQFQGRIPEFQQKNLPNINVANNQLEGRLPPRFSNLNPQFFSGKLCHMTFALYSELPSLIVPHGYLKSSNVLLDNSYKPLLMDYALQPLINEEHAKGLLVAYRSPEYAQHGRVTKKTDVWSLGILILEVLTGKIPTNFLAVGNVKGEDLVVWVNDIATEEEKGVDVFDKEMRGTHNSQVEMKKLLKIGFSCCHENVDVRWSIKEAVEKIEEIKER